MAAHNINTNTLRELFYELRHGATVEAQAEGNTRTMTPPVSLSIVRKAGRYELTIEQGVNFVDYPDSWDEPGARGWTHMDLVHSSAYRTLAAAVIAAARYGITF